MKNLYGLFSLILMLCLNQSLATGTTIQPVERTIGKLHISIDPRTELLTTIQLLSGNNRVNRISTYSKEVSDYFKSFSSHEAVLMTDSLSQKYGFGADAPVAFMFHLSQLPKLEQEFAYTDHLERRSGKNNNLERYRRAIKQFAEISDFETFWNNKTEYYNQILDLTIAGLGNMDMIKILEDYYNETKKSYTIILMPAFSGGVGFKITDTDGEEMIYSGMATNSMKDNIPYLDKGKLHFWIWHEFGHSFVNPVTDKYSDRLPSSSKLFEPIKGFMAKGGYNLWKSCVNEHIIRAVHIRLSELYVGSEQAKTLSEDELKERFIYVEPLIEKLKDYENQKDKSNITFSEFYPHFLNLFDSLQKTEYWKQFNLNFNGPIFGTLVDEKIAIIYPTDDPDTEALDIVQKEASQLFDYFTQIIDNSVLFADTTALTTDLSQYAIYTYGTIESNLFLKRYAADFPFRIDNQTIYADKEYTDKNLKFISCVPNPFNPKKGMAIHTAISNRGIQGINEPYYKNDFEFLNVDYLFFLNHETLINNGFYKKDENNKWTF